MTLEVIQRSSRGNQKVELAKVRDRGATIHYGARMADQFYRLCIRDMASLLVLKQEESCWYITIKCTWHALCANVFNHKPISNYWFLFENRIAIEESVQISTSQLLCGLRIAVLG